MNSLRRFENIRLYPSILSYSCSRLIDECVFYLDINHEDKNESVIEEVKLKGKPILSFNNVENPYHVDRVCPSQYPQEMCNYILNLLGENGETFN